MINKDYNKQLIRQIENIKYRRLMCYGNLAYQQLSGDWYLEHYPDELWEVWYSRDNLSFTSITKDYINLHQQKNHELLILLEKEETLLAQVQEIFQKIKNEKDDEFNGKN